MINVKTQIIIVILITSALFIIVNMIRRKSLELRYALIWLLVGMGILILTCFPALTIPLSDVLGIATPMNMLFFMGFCFALAIIFSLTIAVSRMSIKIKMLAQELALHKKETEVSFERNKNESEN